MKTIKLQLYSFNELEKAAKAEVLTTYRDLNVNFDWWDQEYEDFITLCGYMGISVTKSSIKFNGFYSQGDGSSYAAKVDLKQLNEAILTQAWKAYAPLQEFPFAPCGTDRRVLSLLAKGLLPAEPQIGSRKSQYEVLTDLGISVINENGKEHDNVFDELEKLEAWLRNIARTLNKYLYHTLEKQYDYLISDDAVQDSILNNDYLFTADGRPANHLEKLAKRKTKN